MGSRLSHNVKELLDILLNTAGDPADLSSTLQHVAQTAQTFFAADICIISAINPITGQFMPSLTIAGDPLKGEMSREQPRAEELQRLALKPGVLLIEDVESWSEDQRLFMNPDGIRSIAVMGVRMRRSQKPLGVVYLGFRQPQQFDSDDHALFQVFTEQTSFILEETWLLQSHKATMLQQRYQEVARIGQEINHELATIDILFQKVQEYVVGFLDASHTLLLAVYQAQSNTFDLYLEEEGRVIFQSGVPLVGACRYVIETRQPLFIRQSSVEAVELPFQSINIEGTGSQESLIFVPLVLRDVPLGVLSIQHPRPNAYTQEDLVILQSLANYIALALHNIRSYNSLRQLNETGQLLMQQLESEQVLQMTVEKIRDATQADVVILYPYESTSQYFILPPRIVGPLLDSTPQSMNPIHSHDIAALMIHRREPIFAKESATLSTTLRGNVRTHQESFEQREQIRSTAAMPLQVGDESAGVLFVNFRQPQRFDATQKLLIEGLAHYAAIAIKNAQAFGTLSQRRLRELEILQHIERELSRTLDLESVLNTLLRMANEQVLADESSILLYDPRIQALIIPAAIGPHAEARRTRVFSLYETKGIQRWVLENKKPARVDNVHLDPLWRDLYIPTAPDTISELDVPLLDGEEAVGVLNFESTRESAFRQEDEDFLITLAGQAVLAIKNAQAYEREKRLAEEGLVLNEISKEITSQLDPVRVFDLILEKALELTDSNLGNLMLYDPAQNDLWMAAERGVAEDKKGIRQGLGQGIEGHAAKNKQLLNVDVTRPPWNEIYLEFFPGARSEIAVPMLAGNELRGVLNVESPSPNNFSERDERLLQGLADLAVVALQNAERYNQAERETQRFTLLYQAGQELSKITDLAQIEQAYEVVVQIAGRQSQSQVVIYRYDEINAELVLKCASHRQAPLFERIKLDEGLNGQVARERRTIVVHNIDHLPLDAAAIKQVHPGMHSFVVIPVLFKDQYYGNLELRHENNEYFQGTDILFFEGLAQQLATTIYRLETSQERQEFKQRALSAELMSTSGYVAFELTHRWDNQLGLVKFYVNDIRSELRNLNVTNSYISEKLENIAQAVGAILGLSQRFKQALVRSGEATAGEPFVIQSREIAGEPTVIHPRVLLEEALDETLLPSTIQICLEVDDDVAAVRVIHNSVADILRNLLANAIEAMPEGGKIVLRAHNAGRSVALEVKDTGVGIPQQNLSKIFDLFYSTKGSSGFGLWSARRNALRNHGDLMVESEVGQGTTFTLLLPKVEGETL